MKWHEGALPGLFLIEPEPQRDERGSFTRVLTAQALEARGLVAEFSYEAVSENVRAGTLRGLHFQAEPFGETKIVTCASGSMFDVIVDLREGPSYGKSASFVLERWQSLYVPRGCAHGFQTLEDATTVLYRIAGEYRAEAARGVRYDDPELAIGWPSPPSVLSDRDAALPRLGELGA
jgi:dTDP-4-dehydrorhamnose 3,5-epimerase